MCLVDRKGLMKVSCPHLHHPQVLNGNRGLGAALTFDMQGPGCQSSPGKGLFLRPHGGAGDLRPSPLHSPPHPHPCAAVGAACDQSRPGCQELWAAAAGAQVQGEEALCLAARLPQASDSAELPAGAGKGLAAGCLRGHSGHRAQAACGREAEGGSRGT